MPIKINREGNLWVFVKVFSQDNFYYE